MENHFQDNDSKNALEAQYAAQKIAFAPIIFQVAKNMRDLGVLELLFKAKDGLTLEEISEKIEISSYGLQVLLETSLSADIVKLNENKYFITKTGYFLCSDEMTKINMDFNHYVNYQGLYYLDEALKEEKASGLKTFGDWSTIYPALSRLPSKAKESWFSFDHFYSDSAFSKAIEILLKKNVKKVLDIGGNTGKFSMALLDADEKISATIADLPQQISLARKAFADTTLEERISFHPMDILDGNEAIPVGYDAIWMSQFLDCFCERDIIKILQKAKRALDDDGRLFIMEPLWDKQRFKTSAYCIINTSPYFTALANGYSKMFNGSDLKRYIEKAGLKVQEEIDNIGLCQSIIICK